MLRLKQLRKEKNLTQQQVADYLGINQSTYYYWESEKINVDAYNLERLARFYSVPIDYLLGRTSSPNSDFPPMEQFVKDMEAIGITEEKLAAMTPEQRKTFYATIKALVQSFVDNRDNNDK